MQLQQKVHFLVSKRQEYSHQSESGARLPFKNLPNFCRIPFDPSSSDEPRRVLHYSPEMIVKKSTPSLSTDTLSISLEKIIITSKKLVSFNPSNNVLDLRALQILQEKPPIPQRLIEVLGRARQFATVSTSVEHIKTRKCA